jgi:hypothetical protein
LALVPVPLALPALAALGAGGGAKASAATWAGNAVGVSFGKAVALSAAAAVVLVTAGAAYAFGLFGPDGQALAGVAVSSAPATTSTPPPSTASSAPSSSAALSSSAPPSTSTQAAPPPKPAAPNAALPVRAAFYYPWYAENFTEGGSRYTASAGKYSMDDPATIERQIEDMQYGGLEAGISSWWGRGKREDVRLPLMMSKGAELGFSWTVYYEHEAYADPSPAEINDDLTYLRKYSDQPTWLHIDGKPVIFVYNVGADACDMVSRWTEANKTAGYYVVLKVFGGYRDCADQPSSWHQYASGFDVQKGYSAIVSPGFWKNDEPDRVPRDLERFRKEATAVATSSEPFQLVVTYNEWGEGTSVESATAWASPSGHGAYMDILHEVFSAHPG